jgi:16S rRNA processing protein RimM
MGRLDPTHLVVGHLSKAHGTKGEMLVRPMTDHPESTFAPGVVLFMGGAEDERPDPDLPPLRVDEVRPFQRGLLVRFGGVEDRNQAEVLRGRYLFRPIEDLEPLAEGEVFHHQLVGMTVRTVEGEEVGQVQAIYELDPSDLLEIHGPKGTVMVPYRKEIVVELDVGEGRMVIDPPEGLLDL